MHCPPAEIQRDVAGLREDIRRLEGTQRGPGEGSSCCHGVRQRHLSYSGGDDRSAR